MKTMKIKILLICLLCFAGITFGQQTTLKIKAGDKTRNIPAIERQGVIYVSARRLADAIGSGVYYNAETSKLEIKFTGYILKLTGSNQFIVLSPRSGKSTESYQMPISSLKIKDDILIPINYSLKAFSKAYGSPVSIEKYTDDSPNVQKETDENISSVMASEEFKIKRKSEAHPQPAAADKKTAGKSSKDTGKTPLADAAKKTEATGKPAQSRETEIKPKLQYDITGIRADVKNNGTLITITSRKKISKYSSTISDGVLYLNLLGVNADDKLQSELKSKGFINKAVVKNLGQNSQIEFHLKDGYSSAETSTNSKSTQIYISIRNKVTTIPESELSKDRWKLDAVVIDAGHGGKDPGAIGVGGQKEKDINLAIALKLGELIKLRMPNVNVIYTRSSDKFVELYKRGKIANESNGKLFISIHCNSMPKKPSSRNGFEIYLLRPGRTSEAVAIAARENSVIKFEDNPSLYRELTDDNFILVSMAHSTYMRHSEQFSDILNGRLKDNLTLSSNGVKQAGFYVLVGASMPSVLIETGFLSNEKDAEYLSGKSGQTAIAASIFSAVKAYKEVYDKELRAAK